MDQPKSEELPGLPEEVWTTIFKYLTDAELLRLRLVCKRWSQIITETPSLLDRLTFHVRDATDYTLYQQLRPKFGNVKFEGLQNMDAGFGWESIGEILNAAPKLKRLEFERVSTEVVDLLESLSCPELKGFAYDMLISNDEQSNKIVRFIQTNKNTLRELKVLGMQPGFWMKIANIQGLRLTHLEGDMNRVELAQLYPNQPNLKTLRLRASLPDLVIQEIGTKLTQLKSLSVLLDPTNSSASFLSSMPQLNHLSLEGHGPNFGSVRHQNLKHLGLTNVCEPSNMLSNFPNLRTIELIACTLSSWSHLFNSLAHLTHLEQLTLMKCFATESSDIEFQTMSSLQSLTIQTHDFLSPDERVQIKSFIATCCPELCELSLEGLSFLGDDDIRQICQTLQHRLQRIRLIRINSITEEAVHQIFACCPKIEHITLHECRQITRAVVERWDEKKRVLVQFKP